jgi:hypothetical protein
MRDSQWYELRITGSAGTIAGRGSGIREAIAISEAGRLCSVSSGHAKKFATREEAMEFLGRMSLPGIYTFEAVICSHDRKGTRSGGNPA